MIATYMLVNKPVYSFVISNECNTFVEEVNSPGNERNAIEMNGNRNK